MREDFFGDHKNTLTSGFPQRSGKRSQVSNTAGNAVGSKWMAEVSQVSAVASQTNLAPTTNVAASPTKTQKRIVNMAIGLKKVEEVTLPGIFCW